jgi:hypothetical protein
MNNDIETMIELTLIKYDKALLSNDNVKIDSILNDLNLLLDKIPSNEIKLTTKQGE